MRISIAQSLPYSTCSYLAINLSSCYGWSNRYSSPPPQPTFLTYYWLSLY